MSFTRHLSLVLLGLLAAACVVVFAANLERALQGRPSYRLEPGRRQRSTLSAQNLARLRSFDDEIRIRYYVTPREDMPPHLVHIEQGVRDVLAAFQRAADDHDIPLTTRVVYPAEHPEWAGALASSGLATWRARRIEGDGYREDELWSSLRIGYGARPAAVFNGLGKEQVFELQSLILEQLEELRERRRPRIALCAPAGYEGLRKLLASGADVVELDFDENAELPADIDMLFWLEPTHAGHAQLAALDALRASGASLVLAGHDIESQARRAGETFVVEFERGTGAMNALLQHHGLTPLDGLLLDATAGELSSGEGTDDGLRQFAPWYVRSTPNHQDFRTLQGQPNGSLLFRTPSAFDPDPARLEGLGLGCTVLATASAGASLHDLPPAALTTEELDRLLGKPRPNVALAALLRPQDPWTGPVLMLSDSAVFGDASWRQEHYAHGSFVQVVFRTLLSSERMVARRLAARAPASLAPLSAAERVRWRALVVLLLPASLAALFLVRRASGGSAHHQQRIAWRVLAAGFALVPLVGYAARGLSSCDLDLTRDGRNRLTTGERAVFRDLLQESTKIELVFSPPGDLPPEFKPLVRGLRGACARLANSLENLELTNIWPDDEDQLAKLRAAGLQPLTVTSVQAETTRQFRIHAGLRLSRGEREIVLQFPSARSFRHLHFRLAQALVNLQRGRATRLALFAEPPRLSPAEATLEYQRRGLFAPREGDVYSELEDLLTEFDFEITRLEPGRDHLPRGDAGMLWMQPRRDLLDTTAELSRHLHAGGAALVAGQHFRILSRQLEGAQLEQRFWPEPQFFDLDRIYLPALGIELPRAVLFDASHGSMQLQTRVQSVDGGSRHTELPTTEPFVVVGHTQAATGARGQLLMPFATEVRWDAQQLAQAHLAVTPWIAGGARHWSYDWNGGDLPAEVFELNAAKDADTGLEARLTRQDTVACYGALFEGPFPAARVSDEPRALLDEFPASASSEPGKLLLIGSSETFKNGLLTTMDYGHEDFALRAVTSLCLPPDLLPLLAQRRHEAALEPIDEGTRRLWRALVLAGAPCILLLYGLLRRRVA